LQDRFGNATSVVPHALLERARTAGSADAAELEIDSFIVPLAVSGDTPVDVSYERRDNVVFLSATPRAAGAFCVSVSLRVKGDPSVTEATKSIRCAVRSAALDWHSHTTVEATACIVAGEDLDLTVALRDAFANPLPVVEAVPAARDCGLRLSPTAADPSSPFSAVVVNGDQKSIIAPFHTDGNVITFRCRPTVAGQAIVTLRFGDVERVPLGVTVLPGSYSWEQTTFCWEHRTVMVGLPCVCRIEARDAFGNLAANRPASADLEPRCVSNFPVEGLRVEEVDGSFHVAFMTERAQLVSVLIGHKAEDGVPVNERGPEVPVKCESGEVHWPNVKIDIAGPGLSIQVDEEGVDGELSPASPRFIGTLPAGSAVEARIKLFDRFGNPAFHGVSGPEAILVKFRNEGAAIGPAPPPAAVKPVPLEDCVIEGLTPPTRPVEYVGVAVMTQAGRYSVVAMPSTDRGRRFVEETALPTTEFVVAAAAAAWPTGFTWTVDAERVPAGEMLLFQLETRDRFGNPTRVGVEPIAECLDVAVEVEAERDDGAAAARVRSGPPTAMFPQMHQVGAYGINIDALTAGTVRMVVQLREASGADRASVLTDAVASDSVQVVPAAPSWPKCQLVSLTPKIVAGNQAVFHVRLLDRFGNQLRTLRDTDDVKRVIVEAAYNIAGLVSGADVAPAVLRLPASLIADIASRGAAPCVLEAPKDDEDTDVPSSRALEETESRQLVVVVSPKLCGTLVVSAMQDVEGEGSTFAHSAEVYVTPGPAFAADVQTLPLCVAGVPLTFAFKTLDEFGNQVHSPEVTVHAGRETPIKFAVTHADDHTIATGVVSLSGSNPITIITKEGTLVTTIPLQVHHSRAVASTTTFLTAVGGCAVAGSPFPFVLTLRDAFGNVCSDVDTRHRFSCGPAIGASVKVRGSSGDAFVVDVTPTKTGALDFIFLDGDGGELRAPSVTVQAAELHWQSCALRLLDDSFHVGQESQVVIVPRDYFGNSVSVDPSRFRVSVCNGDGEPYDADAPHGGKSITVCFVAKAKGPLACTVVLDGDVASARQLPSVQVRE